VHSRASSKLEVLILARTRTGLSFLKLKHPIVDFFSLPLPSLAFPDLPYLPYFNALRLWLNRTKKERETGYRPICPVILGIGYVLFALLCFAP